MIKINWLAGNYQLTSEKCDYCQKFESKKEFIVNLTALEAKTLMKRKENEDSLYVKLGFSEICLIKEEK